MDEGGIVEKIKVIFRFAAFIFSLFHPRVGCERSSFAVYHFVEGCQILGRDQNVS